MVGFTETYMEGFRSTSHLGQPDEINLDFTGFQQYLYQPSA